MTDTPKTFDEWKIKTRPAVWPLSAYDAFEAGRKAGIEEAVPLADLFSCIINHATLPDAWYLRSIRQLVEFRALAAPQQEDAITGTPEAWDTLNKRIADLDGKEQEGE